MCRSCRKPTRRCARSPAWCGATRSKRCARAAGDDTTAPTPEQRRNRAAARARARAADRAQRSRTRRTILRAYGIATPAEALVDLARRSGRRPPTRIGYPVVLKAVSDTLTHKSDVGAVALNLATPRGTRRSLRPHVGSARRPRARRHAGLPAGPRRARAGARPASRSRDGPGGDGGRRRRAARTHQGRGVLRAAGQPRQGARHARAHPRWPA